jgi:putative restriction endonuclease
MSTAEFPVIGPVLVLDPVVRDAIISQRRVSGGDRYDEVWEGTYVMSPLANLEHRRLVGRLTTLLDNVVESLGKGEVFPGANVTDRTDDWTANYRCPDVVVVLDETRISRHAAATVGGPVLPLAFQWTQQSGKPSVTIRRADGEAGGWLI